VPDEDQMMLQPPPPVPAPDLPAPEPEPAPLRASSESQETVAQALATPALQEPVWEPAPWVKELAGVQEAEHQAAGITPADEDGMPPAEEGVPPVEEPAPAAEKVTRPARPRKAPARKRVAPQAPAAAPETEPAKVPAQPKRIVAAAAPPEKPAPKAPAKRSPVKAPARKAPVKAPAKKAVATRPPARSAAKQRVPRAIVAPPPLLSEPVAMAATEDVVPGLQLAPVPTGRHDANPTWVRVLVRLTMVLLAAAAGLGAAAVVLNGTPTWKAEVAVQLRAPEAPTTDPTVALSVALHRYAAAVPASTSSAESLTRVPAQDVRGELRGTTRGPDKVVVTAAAASSDAARALAVAGAQSLLDTVQKDQAQVRQGDRVVAVLADSGIRARRTEPTRARAVAAAGLAAGAVLVLGLLALLRPRRAD
jgi:hypothetical protein